MNENDRTNISVLDGNARLNDDIQNMDSCETLSTDSIDLMESDSEHDTLIDCSSENSCGRDYVDDDIVSDEDVSFY